MSKLIIACLLSFLLCTGGTLAQDIENILGGSTTVEENQQAQKAIDTLSTPGIDAEIAQRLQGIYSELDVLDGIDVEVTSGVVTLSGTASSASALDRATQLAEQMTGVVDVVDQTVIDNSLGQRFNSTLLRWKSILGTALLALPTFIVALFLFSLFWIIGRWVAGKRNWFRRVTPNGFIANLFGSICRIIITLFGVVLALSLLDATSIIGTVLGAAGIVGLAVGFAVRDTVENYIASILLSLRQPFNSRDFVDINGNEGQVARLTSRATILVTLEGNHVRIPNSEVYKATIINYTRNPYRRFEFTVGVDTDLDLKLAQDLAVETVQHVSGVLPEPQALALIEALGDSNVSLNVICWIDQRSHDMRKVRSESIRQVKRAFDEAGIVMPEPIYRLKITSDVKSSSVRDSLAVQNNFDVIDTSADLSTLKTDSDEASQGSSRAYDVNRQNTPVYKSDCADTSNDTAVTASLEKEIAMDSNENLLMSETAKE